MKYLILLLLPTLAFADSWTTASSYSHASAQAGAIAGAVSGGNTQTVNVAPGSGGNQSVNFKYPTPVPPVMAPSISPTSPCMGSSSGGGSGTGFGLSFGTSWTDDECNTRETSRLFHSMGMTADALAVLCSSAYASAAPSCAGKEKPCHADEIVARRLGVGVCK